PAQRRSGPGIHSLRVRPAGRQPADLRRRRRPMSLRPVPCGRAFSLSSKHLRSATSGYRSSGMGAPCVPGTIVWGAPPLLAGASNQRRGVPPMTRKVTLMSGLTALAIGISGLASAESVTDPKHSFGLSASHHQYRVDTALDDDKDRLNKGGVFYNWGNKLTGQEGWVYQIGADAQYGERGDSEVKSGRIELDVGGRMQLST